jgi:autotransporter strand-loop-strand O-heptosyltransferase
MKTHHHAKRLHQAESVANACSFSFVDGAFVEIKGAVDEDYLVQFIDTRTNEIVHQQEIKTNHWVRTARQYFTPWQVNVFRLKDHHLLFTHPYDCRQKRVYIAVESKALGDTLAWFQLLEDFQRQHGCQLICSTFMNGLFQEQYPDIQFVEPSETVHNLYAMYRVGWFSHPSGEIDFNRNVKNFRLQTLGESGADILGLPYTPIRPRIKATDLGKPIADDYVCIAVHSTAQAKYWNNPTGWTEVVAYLRQRGYQVVLLSREGLHYMGNQAPADVMVLPPGDIGVIVNYLRHAKFFIGVGSGLSWLSWAMGCKTCVISGFSYPYTEVEDMIRIAANADGCSGCFNRHPMDAGDWQWCPDHKNTPRMFECTRNISAQQVIAVLTAHLMDVKSMGSDLMLVSP